MANSLAFTGRFDFEPAAGLKLGASIFTGDTGQDREPVQRAVELAVAAMVEAVACGVAGGGGDRDDADGAGELGVGGEALGAGDLADQLGGGQHAAAALGEQARRELGDQAREFALE